jgi:sialidase-1
MDRRRITSALVALLSACSSGGSSAPRPRCADYSIAETDVERATIFQGGEDGYPHYRIPAAVTTDSGVLVAFAEARQTTEDPGAGEIDVVMKRSLDCGRSWSGFQVLADNGSGDAHNPAAVVAPDHEGTSLVWLFYGLRPASAGGEFDLPAGLGPDSARVWFRTSPDDGETWSEPREITADVKDPTWAVTSPGPGQAIYTRWGNGEASPGRILVPGWYHLEGEPGPEGSFVFFSDDGGHTWARGGLPEPSSNEAQVMELTDGTILMDARQNVEAESNSRFEFRSTDGGMTWSGPNGGLPMTPIMSGIVRHSAERDGDDRDLLIHTGVAPDGRVDVRVWSSDDEAQTWAHETTIDPGFAQYSLAAILDDRTIGVVYESIETEPPLVGRLNILFARFDVAWVEGQ